MPRFAANLTLLCTGLPMMERFAAAKAEVWVSAVYHPEGATREDLGWQRR
ncbi:hypothetical protein [Ostreiculturibacter nitratireducens]